MIGQHLNITSGCAFKSSKFNSENKGMPLIRIRDVGKDESSTFYDGEFDDAYLIKKGDFLVGMDGEFRLAEWQGPDSLLNQRVCKLDPDPLIFDRRYFYHILPAELKRIEDTTSFVTVKHLSVKKIREIEIPLPPLATQKKIAAILDAADAHRQKTKQLLAKYDELAQSIFLDMFGDPVTNPKGWEVKKFSDVGKLDRGKSKHRPRNAPELLGGEHPLIQTGDVANSSGYIKSFKSTYSDLGLSQSKMWPSGTLCITIAANIAKTGILTFDACFPDSVVGFIPNEKTTNEYVQGWMKFLQKIIEDSAPESAQKNINLKILRDLEFMLPAKTLQLIYTKAIGSIEEQRSLIREGLNQSEYLFNSLLQKAFKGELV